MESHRGNKHPKWTGYGEISGQFWNQIVKGAKKRKYKIEITIKEAWEQVLKQNKKCAISGLDLVFKTFGRDKNHNASLDRIDSSKGYTLNNIQWVHKDLNIMKQSYSNEYFIKMCSLVGNFNKNK